MSRWQTLAGRRHRVAFKLIGHLMTGERPIGNTCCDHVDGSGAGGGIELELVVTAGHACVDQPAGQLEEPPEVVGRHVMPRGPEDVGPEQLATVEGRIDIGRGQRTGPRCATDQPRVAMLLRLQRHEVTHHVAGGTCAAAPKGPGSAYAAARSTPGSPRKRRECVRDRVVEAGRGAIAWRRHPAPIGSLTTGEDADICALRHARRRD